MLIHQIYKILFATRLAENFKRATAQHHREISELHLNGQKRVDEVIDMIAEKEHSDEYLAHLERLHMQVCGVRWWREGLALSGLVILFSSLDCRKAKKNSQGEEQKKREHSNVCVP